MLRWCSGLDAVFEVLISRVFFVGYLFEKACLEWRGSVVTYSCENYLFALFACLLGLMRVVVVCLYLVFSWSRGMIYFSIFSLTSRCSF